HIFIVNELKRLGVQWVSLAPRYVGRFEKGVDYIGDLQELEADLAGHAAIARAFGPYKLSLHSGSDKFSVYPLIVAAARGVVHLKTAGTSYLEALRAIARVNAPLFRELLALAIERYPIDCASYHVSADVSRVARPQLLRDANLPDVLDQFDTREALHVTFGSALAQYGDDIRGTLMTHEAEHYAALEAHFIRHLMPFAYR
ncbi:MAG TPA: tagaturonate epimerase family protein, partial [Anaerolineae bacterium]|nr:tagaturonate epimerase family protein [Anaerolineae bacterium]